MGGDIYDRANSKKVMDVSMQDPRRRLGGVENPKMHQNFHIHLTFLLFRAEKKNAGQLRFSGTSPFVCARFRSRQANASCSNTGLK